MRPWRGGGGGYSSPSPRHGRKYQTHHDLSVSSSILKEGHAQTMRVSERVTSEICNQRLCQMLCRVTERARCSASLPSCPADVLLQSRARDLPHKSRPPAPVPLSAFPHLGVRSFREVGTKNSVEIRKFGYVLCQGHSPASSRLLVACFLSSGTIDGMRRTKLN